MKKIGSILAALAVVVSSTPSLAGTDAVYAGTWSCEVATFTFTDETYDAGEGPMTIENVEIDGGNYILTFADGYQIGLSSVTDTSMEWMSMASGDMFHCNRVQ